MIVNIEQPDKTYVLMDIGTPKCGELFCDTCGDCWHCYSDDPCIDGSMHSWVVYYDDELARRARNG